MQTVKVLLVIMLQTYINAADITRDCLACICQVEGCRSQVGKCVTDSGSLSCGPYQIKRPYWIDCGMPGADYRRCTTQMQCSERCVGAYMSRYAARCAHGRTPTCQDYARVHNGGPQGCRRSATLAHWRRVQKCCTDKNCDDDYTSSTVPASSHAIRYHYQTASASFWLLLLSSLLWLL